MIDLLRLVILKFLHPIMAYWGKLHMPWTRKKITAAQLDEMINIAEAGDVLLSFTKGEFTNLTIPGRWKHASMLSYDKKYVIEAKGDGVLKTDIRDFMLKKDRVALVRPKLGIISRIRSAEFAETLVGKPYDFRFNIPRLDDQSINEAFYCSELPHWCYLKRAVGYKFKLRNIFGTQAIEPDDYWNALEHFQLRWLSN